MFAFPGHFAIGLILSHFMRINAVLFIIGNLIPDLDVLPYLFGVPYRRTHRTITHSAFMPLLLLLFSPALALGCLTHIFVDILTFPGIKLFFPFSSKEYYFYRGHFKKYHDPMKFFNDSFDNHKRMALEVGLLVTSLFFL